MFTALLSIFWSQWTIFLGCALFAAYKWSTATYDFFAKKNVAFDKPVPLLGNFSNLLLQQESFFDTFKRLYLKNRDRKYFGFYEMRNPVLMITSPDLVKQITVKDFDYFLNHRIILDPEDEPLFGNSLFSLKNQKWKDMRATLSPAFTGSKMRMMFQLVDECGSNAIKYLKLKAESENRSLEVNLKDFYTRFTNDFFKVRLFDKKFSNYFHNLVLDTMRQRAEKGIIRPDMINLLMEARKGTLQATDLGKADTDEGFATVQESTVGQKGVSRNWTDDDIVSQCFLFFVAGFETSSVLMCFCAHELMENPEVQKKLIQEVDQVREELADKPLTYEALQKMKYMDLVMSETLRKWPPAIATDRVCNKPYVIGDKDGDHVKMNVGDLLQIPTCGFHHDPDYFPEPDRFDPERFNDENKDQIKPFTYMPFGVGPRNCIGSRFALMESKAIMYHLLTEFTFEASSKSTIPMKLSSSGFQLQPKGGFWLNFKPRK